jgi:hypothetical protein
MIWLLTDFVQLIGNIVWRVAEFVWLLGDFF